ncbi:hypothetical protein Igag_0702 [Ignisphaera aggregans DSM 17230]|uniref:Uncharacterized protein n=1 Tax=Ignisphaera aggregans (strain DSM 17230 / JCM 13409 / AQ1.S1) TaxID=583356 RepID=E0SSY2_IGNAA|nr:hypothetical protein Igag_0702 [Ignisphaera aggregans DSM 17230]
MDIKIYNGLISTLYSVRKVVLMEGIVEALRKLGELDTYQLFEEEYTVFMDIATKILGNRVEVERDVIDKMLRHYNGAIFLGSRIKNMASINWMLESEERDMIIKFILSRIEDMRQKLIDVIEHLRR